MTGHSDTWHRPFNPKYSKGKCKMWDDSTVLLSWACNNRAREASISIIAEETGIPRMTLHWILIDAVDRKGNSILARAAAHFGYEYHIYTTWNRENAHKRKKKIIDAVKMSEKYDNY